MSKAVMHADSVARPATCWTLNQHIAFDWAVRTVLPMVKPGGVWIAPAFQSPLTFTQIIEVFLAISEHPTWRQQSMQLQDRDGQPVILNVRDGERFIEIGL